MALLFYGKKTHATAGLLCALTANNYTVFISGGTRYTKDLALADNNFCWQGWLIITKNYMTALIG